MMGALPAAAVDLDKLSRQEKRNFCISYVWIDLKGQEINKVISQSQFKSAETQLFMKTMARGSRSNFAQTGRDLDQSLKVIAAEKPTNGEVAQKAAYCRAYLKI